jgi:[ribosomal protein S5]-alanine N-acetyltransferase
MTSISIVPALETPRLILREMEQVDASELANFLTQPRYQRHITHRLRNENEVNAFVRRNVMAQIDTHRRVFHLVAEETMSGEVIGDAFIIAHNDGSHEVGWGVHPALWQMGFGTEIGRAVLGLGFERLKAKTLWCKVMSPNKASARLSKRIGMKLGSVQTNANVGNGRVETVEIYRMSAEQYFELPY